MRFCYQCIEWLTSRQWRNHCNAHLKTWDTKHCEVVTYRHTVIRPGYCPFCLWNLDLPAEDRLHYWLKSGNLKGHIEERHIRGILWPMMKSLCGCAQTFDDERGLRHHLHDVHGLNNAIWLNPKLPRKRKRSCKGETQGTSTKHKEPPKKLRFYRYPPPRHEHEYQLSDTIFLPIPTLLTFIEEHPEQYVYSSVSGESTCS